MLPIFRFTLGPCIPQGIDILIESINKTTKILGENSFSWYVCHNGTDKSTIEFIQSSISIKNINFYEQDWKDCPIEDNCSSPKKKDGTFEWDGHFCGGTLWKVCPPRLNINVHEIIMDNDIVMIRKLNKIDQFLNDDKVMILEEPIRFYGRYDFLFNNNQPNLNSGFIGLPPNYDYGKEIKKTWEENGKYKNISQADEQGLLVYTLNKYDNIRIHKEEIVEVLARSNKKITGFEFAIHFTQANKIPDHYAWIKYKNLSHNLYTI